MCALSQFSHVLLFGPLWTVTRHVPLFMRILQARILGVGRHALYGDLPNPGIEPVSLMSLALAGWFLTTSATREVQNYQDIGLINGEGNGTPLQYSCLENPMDGGAW